MPVTFTCVSGWRWPWRLWYPVLFLNLWIRIFGPLVWATTSPVTATLASTAASVTRSSPSTRSTAGRVTASPAAPASFSTSITSPSATLYCLPPVLTIAYIGRGLPETYAAITAAWRMVLARPGSYTDAEHGAWKKRRRQAYFIRRADPNPGSPSAASLVQGSRDRRHLLGVDLRDVALERLDLLAHLGQSGLQRLVVGELGHPGQRGREARHIPVDLLLGLGLGRRALTGGVDLHLEIGDEGLPEAGGGARGLVADRLGVAGQRLVGRGGHRRIHRSRGRCDHRGAAARIRGGAGGGRVAAVGVGAAGDQQRDKKQGREASHGDVSSGERIDPRRVADVDGGERLG